MIVVCPLTFFSVLGRKWMFAKILFGLWWYVWNWLKVHPEFYFCLIYAKIINIQKSRRECKINCTKSWSWKKKMVNLLNSFREQKFNVYFPTTVQGNCINPKILLSTKVTTHYKKLIPQTKTLLDRTILTK